MEFSLKKTNAVGLALLVCAAVGASVLKVCISQCMATCTKGFRRTES